LSIADFRLTIEDRNSKFVCVAGQGPVRFSSFERPEESPMERHLAALVYLASFVYLYLFWRYTAMDPDEGIILQGAERILHGQVLYRDFFSFFTPGSYYLLALLFRTFGSSILVARSALVFLGSILSVLAYLLARRVSSRWVALVTAALATLTCLPYRFLVLHNWDSTLWACLALYAAVRCVEEGRSQKREVRSQKQEATSPNSGAARWAFALGSFVSLTMLFEQSKGAGLALGLAAGFAVLATKPQTGNARSALLLPTPDPPPIPPQTGSPRSALLLSTPDSPPALPQTGNARSALLPNPYSLLLGLAWPFLVTFVWFGAQHALTLVLADWLWPLHHYSRANHVPYGYQNWSDSTSAILFGTHSWGHRLIAVLVVAPCFLVPVFPLVAAGILVYKAVESRQLVLATGNPRQKEHPLSPDFASAPEGAAEFSPGCKPWVGVAPSQRAPERAKEGATARTLTPLRGYGLIAGSVSQGSRPGLTSCGPPGLKPMRCSGADLRHEVVDVERETPLDLQPSTFDQASVQESRTQGDRQAYYILVSATLSGLLLSVVAGRADILHFMYLAPLSYLVLAWILDGRDVHSSFFHAILPVLRVLLLTCFGFFALAMLLRNLGGNVRVGTRRGVISTTAPDTVLEYVQAHVTAGSRILVYPYLPLYYYLTDTFSPTSYEYIQPGMHTREQMAEVERDLASGRTPMVLYEYSFAEKIPRAWPNTPIEFIARDPIADLILGQYRNCQMLNSAAGWRFLFMVRKDLKCP
jgi:hypothetical protein